MAISQASPEPQIIMFSNPKAYYRNPHLLICGMWINDSLITGDNSGGTITQLLNPLPSTPKLPLLPSLQCWYTLQNLAFRNNQSAMKETLQLYSNFCIPGSVWNAYSLGITTTAGGDGYWDWTNDFYKEWIAYYDSIVASTYRGLKFTWETNTNTKLYYAQAQGLILKTEQQLVTEGLLLPK